MKHKELVKQAKLAGESLGRTGLEHDETKTFVSGLLHELRVANPDLISNEIYEVSSAFFQGFGAGQTEAK